MHPDNCWMKCQRPLASNAPEPMALVYTEDSDLMFTIASSDLDKAVAAWPETDGYKFFVLGRLAENSDGTERLVVDGAAGPDAFDW